MSEQIERVAKAIADRLSRDSKGECLLIATDEQAADIARSAITAMREPTYEMISVGLLDAHPRSSWQAMIDEALK